MKSHTEPLQPETYYHIYNRGINGEQLFKETRNYRYFLDKYAQYLEPVAETYAYCLLGNHFHILIRTRTERQILENLGIIKVGSVWNAAHLKHPIAWYISNQFSKLFNCFTQSINKAHRRTGGLFEEPFRRIPITSDIYLTRIIYYIHANPQKHGFIADFRAYAYSSYLSHLSEAKTRLSRKAVLEWFGNASEYEINHRMLLQEQELQKFIIEFDE
ncbi:MAG: hypothetical protein V4714_19805 [Bacteroidota bacterium]